MLNTIHTGVPDVLSRYHGSRCFDMLAKIWSFCSGAASTLVHCLSRLARLRPAISPSPQRASLALPGSPQVAWVDRDGPSRTHPVPLPGPEPGSSRPGGGSLARWPYPDPNVRGRISGRRYHLAAQPPYHDDVSTRLRLAHHIASRYIRFILWNPRQARRALWIAPHALRAAVLCA